MQKIVFSNFQRFSPKIRPKIAEKHVFSAIFGGFQQFFALFRWIFSQKFSAKFSAIFAAKRRIFFQQFFQQFSAEKSFSAISRNLKKNTGRDGEVPGTGSQAAAAPGRARRADRGTPVSWKAHRFALFEKN